MLTKELHRKSRPKWVNGQVPTQILSEEKDSKVINTVWQNDFAYWSDIPKQVGGYDLTQILFGERRDDDWFVLAITVAWISIEKQEQRSGRIYVKQSRANESHSRTLFSVFFRPTLHM